MKIITAFIVTALCSFAVGTAQTADSEKRNSIKVLTFNILHGATTKGSFDFDVIANVIIEADPDVVALQEVDFNTERGAQRDNLVELALRTNMTPVFINAMDYDGGEYGEGLLSKRSFVEVKNISLPHSLQNEPKAAAYAVLRIDSGDSIGFIGTHLDHLKEGKDRLAQAKALNSVFVEGEEYSYPMILAGDLNDVPGSRPIRVLEEYWTASQRKNNPKATFPSHKPKVKIDYVMFYPKKRWKVLEEQVICDTIASDHCAYLVELELLPR